MRHVAIDVGASGGTVYLGRVTSSTVDVAEVHRFDNRPVERDGRYVWDLAALESNLADGLRAADAAADDGIDTVGVDTWGLDFALLRDGEVLRDPTTYRDPSATATREELFEAVGKRQLFDATGITHWNTPNSLWQLHSIATREPELLDRADQLLMMPQLLASLLGGRQAGEVTVASTTQMVDPETRDWATDILEELSLPTDVLPPLEEPGGRLGPVAEDVAADLATTPARVSVAGFFLLEECRAAWREAGDPVAYDSLLAAARAAPARNALVDPDAEAFGIEGPMPDQIRAYCRDTDQPVPESRGEVVRCLLDSLVTKTAMVFDQLAAATGTDLDAINLGGGGVRNGLFCQVLADATGRPVQAGPTEATAIGNLVTQAVAVDTLPDVEAARRLVAAEFEPTTYEPAAVEDWDQARERIASLEGG
jgi:rhamnulokinase